MLYETAIGLPPGGSSTVHIYTQIQRTTQKQYIDQHNRNKQYTEQHNSLIRKSAGRAPSLRGIPWHLPNSWGKSTEKNLSQGSRRMSVGTMKTEYTEQNIYNNKNT